MKKIILGMAVVASSVAFGQKFGIKAGANLSNLSSDGALKETKAKIGFNAGAFVNIPVGTALSIQPEIMYNKLGAKTTLNLSGFNNIIPGIELPKVENTMNLDYISVPIMVQYHIVPSLLYVEAGPEFSYLITSNVKTSISNGNVVTEVDSFVKQFDEAFKKENLNSMNFGVAVGAGVNITETFGVNARYVAGITDSTKKSDGSNKNSVIQLGLSYSF